MPAARRKARWLSFSPTEGKEEAGNACKTQRAFHLQQKLRSESDGRSVSSEICGGSIQCLQQQRTRSAKEYLAKMSPNYLIITMKADEEHRPRVFPGMQHKLEWPFDDPCQVDGTDEEKLAAFRRVRDQIDERVRARLKEMQQHDDSKDSHVVMR
jgi:arsenate reductase